MKQKFETLTVGHTNPTTNYKKLKREYDNLLYNSQHMEELNADRKLLYAMLDNRGFASISDKYRETRQDGKSSIGELMEIEKYRSRHFPHHANSDTIRQQSYNKSRGAR